MKKRVYVVQNTSDEGAAPRLVRATSKSAALRHVTEGVFDVRSAKPADFESAMSAGTRVEEAAETAELEGVEGAGEAQAA